MTRPSLPLILSFLSVLTASSALAQRDAASRHWVATWAASQQIPEPQNALAPEDLRDATLRQIVHLSLGGDTLRIRVSNAFGTAPLHLTSVHIARPLSPPAPNITPNITPRIDPASDRPLTFSGSPDLVLPAGAEILSDPIPFPAAPLSDLAVSIHFDQPPAVQTGHPGSRETSWFVHGDLVSAPDLPNPRQVEHWYQLTGIDVLAPSAAASIVTLGDSITDGHAALTNQNTRWPDELARRLQASPSGRLLGVANQGIGGNHLLTDGLGPNALARFDRDVLATPGARFLILLEGVNDLGGLTREHDASPAEHALLVHQILESFRQIIDRAHDRGLKVFGATILPDGGSGYYHPGPASEADRQAINTWIRQPGHFDAVIDFDQVTRDPSNPTHMLPALDSGDHLHPSPAGYKAMGDAIPLTLFTAPPR